MSWTICKALIINTKNKQFKYCNGSGYSTYIEYTLKRRHCVSVCGRDCIEENYNAITEEAEIVPDSNSVDANYISKVIIKPDRMFQEVVIHSKEMDIFNLVGSLGGHAHLWLGLSFISLYDVFYKLIVKIKFLWDRFVEW